MSKNKSIISQFFLGTIFIGGARVSTIVFGLVSVMLITRNMTTDDYGVYVLIMLFSSFLTNLLSFGLGLVIPKYLAGNEDESYKTTLINTTFHFKIIVVLVVGLSIVTFRLIIAGFLDNPSTMDILKATPLVFLVLSFTQLFESILRGRLEFRAIGMIEFISEVIELVLLILFVVVYRFGFWGLVMAKVASQTIYSFLAFHAIHFEHRWEFNVALLKEMLKFGIPLQAQFVFDFAISRLDTLIVGSLLGTRGVAFYDIAKKIPDSLMQLYSVFISVYFPLSANIYATEKKEKTDYLINNSIRLVAFLAAFAALIIAFFGKNIIVLLFSEEYLAIYWVLVLLMIGLTLEMVENILGFSLVAIGEPDKPLYINIMRGIVSLVGNLTILPILGYMGAAIVYVLGIIISVPANVFFLQKREISPKFVVLPKLMFIIGLLSLSLLLWSPIAFPVKILLVLMYIPLSFFLSVISIRDVEVIFGEVNKLAINVTGGVLRKFKNQ